VQQRQVRFRTVGDITCTCPVESTAATPDDIVIETLAAEFVSGHALNQAWNKTDLEHCDVLPLLRLYEEEPSDE
jgi:3'-phosphoadenosine 5'-phosphosulfate sulfotransferase (PAPS reductase)/FAD synthetase